MARSRSRRGFTLMEILVVVILLGVIAVAGANQYLKSAESSRAEIGSNLVSQVAHANLLYYVDHQAYLSGKIDNTTCSGLTGCPASTSQCSLITCGYLKMRNWDNQPYIVWAGNGDASAPACGDAGIASMNPANVAACGRRRKNSDSGSGGTANATYGTWGYTMNTGGQVTVLGTGAPSFAQ